MKTYEREVPIHRKMSLMYPDIPNPKPLFGYLYLFSSRKLETCCNFSLTSFQFFLDFSFVPTDWGLGWGQEKRFNFGSFCLSWSLTFWAFSPKSTIAFSPGRRKSLSNFIRCSRPSFISFDFGRRVFLPCIFSSSPIYHGTIFHINVSFLQIFTSLKKLHMFTAVWSGLFREMKPESTAWGPAASNKKNTFAFTPPSQGSKYGISNWSPFFPLILQRIS